MATFTALNGGEPRSSDNPGSSLAGKHPTSEERSEVPVTGQESKVSADGSSNQQDHWPTFPGDGSTYRSGSYPDVGISPKRKRSESDDLPREPQAGHDDRATSQQSQPEPHDPHAASQRDRDYRPYGEPREHNEAWYSQQHREDRHQTSASGVPSQTDEHMGDPMRRPPDMMDHQPNYSPTSPDEDSGFYGGAYGSDGRRDSGLVQSDPKKRKRNFSNRTKTGCMTCRRRKKKCDEAKPECNNCIKGGFICHGYPNQRGYQKMENKPSAVPLESKDPSYVPPGAYGMPQQPTYGGQPATSSKRDQPHIYRGQPLRIDPPQGRPVLTDDDRQTASTIPTASVASATSPENKLSAMSAYPANAFPTPISAIGPAASNFSERGLQKDYQRIPSLHEAARNEPETPHPGALPQIHILHATRTSSPVAPPPPPPPPPQTTSVQVAAQLALSQSHFQAATRQPTQKELMLQGQLYRPFDKELVLERERCSAACWRFNSSTNPNNGVSTNERSRLFREILMPKEPINMSPALQSPVSNVGRVGQDVVVEAPFTCDYGYNITIGQNVFIGRNCTIIDPCSIKIGNNAYIGPNVSLFAATLQTDPSKRLGSKSLQSGSPIVIDDDVWIGGGAIILPGRKVGKGATVAAGSIVTRVSRPPCFASSSTDVLTTSGCATIHHRGGGILRMLFGVLPLARCRLSVPISSLHFCGQL